MILNITMKSWVFSPRVVHLIERNYSGKLEQIVDVIPFTEINRENLPDE